MPTTTEVEARLRRAAAACEVVVDELAEVELPGPTLSGFGDRRPRRGSSRTGWLVAAALVVVAAVGATVAVVRDEPPGDRIQAASSTTLFDRTPTTDPRAANPTMATPVTLPDGTGVVVDIPGPRRWAPRSSEVVVELEGVAEPVGVALTPLAGTPSDPVVEQQLSDRAAIVTWGSGRVLLVEVDGWVATLHLASDGGDLPDDRAVAVGEDLTFRVTPAGPVDVGGPGLTVTGASTVLVHGDDPYGRASALTVARVGDDDPACGPDVLVVSSGHRCLADDRLRVSARGPEATAVLPGISAAFAGEAPATGPQVPVSLADGTEVVLTIPAGGAWVVDSAVAWVDIDGVASELGPIHVMLHPETALQTAARDGSTLDVLDDGIYLVTGPSGRRRLMIEGGGWTASLSLDDAAAPIPEDVRARLERTWEVDGTAAGPNLLRASGLRVVDAVTFVEPTDPPVDPASGAVDRLSVTRYAEDDHEVRVIPVGPRSEAAEPGLTFEVAPPR